MACLSLPDARIDGRALALRVAAALLGLAFAMGGGSHASAQPVRVGVRAGPTFGFLNDSAIPFVSADGDATANTNVRIDLHAGGYAIVPLGGPYGLHTELLFVRRGGHFSRAGDKSYRVERYQLSYLQGQLLARREVSFSGPLHLHIVGGLTGGRLLDGTAHRAVHTESRVERERIDLAARSLVHRWDIGGLVGLGLSYPVGRAGRVALDLRYNAGFRSIFTGAARSTSDRLEALADPPPLSRTPPSLRHDVVTASLSYTMPLSR